MEFQRRGDIKETIGVGRWANSYKILSLGIHVIFYTKSGKKKGFVQEFDGRTLVSFLEILEERGLCEYFNNFLIMKTEEAFISAGNHPEIFDFEKLEVKTVGINYVDKETFPYYMQRATIPWFFDKFVSYEGKLYEINDDKEIPGYWRKKNGV